MKIHNVLIYAYLYLYKYKSVVCIQGNSPPSYPRVYLHESLSHPESDITVVTTPEQSIYYHMPEEEIRCVYIIMCYCSLLMLAYVKSCSLGPACWMWDYLRRSKMVRC